jgi:hypothetical protein
VGLYRGDLRKRTWEHVPSPMDGRQTWALAISPHDPDVVLAGTRDAALFRSADGGRTWTEAQSSLPKDCVFVDVPRVTQVLWDPEVADRVWCSVEIGGIHRSDDAGRTWHKVPGLGLTTEDVHGLAITLTGGRRLWATLNKGLHVSVDDGETFEHLELATPAQYTRSLVTAADGEDLLLLTNGNGPPGDSGRLLASEDLGETWRELDLPAELRSTVWCVATHPADPRLVFATTNLGQVFRSTDRGATWSPVSRDFGEVRSLLWAPT